MTSPILQTGPLGFPWQTVDPFLFCVHHLDRYPEGDERQGVPEQRLAGRALGADFSGQGGWSMYHGRHVPGFPQHPHRGFETITIARQGFIDHTDSLGAAARFGAGDVQWMTAGAGVVHSEMFPLRQTDGPNTTELFQIWLNLPAKHKLVEPHFTMLWREQLPTLVATDAQGLTTHVTVIAGELEGHSPPKPPPSSWASQPEAHVAVWTLRLEPGATWTLPAATAQGLKRALFFFAGRSLMIAQTSHPVGRRLSLDPSQAVTLHNPSPDQAAELLMLQGRPLGEPVAQHGPFVMNTQAQLRQAFEDYQRTGFGGWPWPVDAPVHPRERGRFALHADGRQEEP